VPRKSINYFNTEFDFAIVNFVPSMDEPIPQERPRFTKFKALNTIVLPASSPQISSFAVGK
jgi:hypothetical protein